MKDGNTMFTPRHSPRPWCAGPGSLPESAVASASLQCAAIVEKREDKQCGVFGIGLKIDVLSPHEVLKVIDLRDANGDSAPMGIVSVSDVLLSVDGQTVENRDASVLESTILGPADSTVCLKLRSADTGETYEFVAMRHVPIRVWQEVHVKRCLRADLVGQHLLADASIVEHLEGIRTSILGSGGSFVDLMRDLSKPDFQCSLGLIFALELNENDANLKPCQVFAVVPGSPASLMGSVLPGDEVVAVDGVEADESNLVKLIEGNNVIGSSCTLSIVRHRTLGEKRPLTGGRITGRISNTPIKASAPARVTISIVGASDMPEAQSEPFVQLSLISASDVDAVPGLDHLTQAGAQQYSWKRSESGRHVIKHVLSNDNCCRLVPQIRSRTLDLTEEPIWNERFELNQAYVDIPAFRDEHESLQDCPTRELQGQPLAALVTLHGRVIQTPSETDMREEDACYGKAIVANLRPGSIIEGNFQIYEANGVPVIGSNGQNTRIRLKLSYECDVADASRIASLHVPRHFDVTLTRCSQSRVDRFQEIVSWFTLLEQELEGNSKHASVSQSLESLQELVVLQEEERCEDELKLANRLYDFENQILQRVFHAESVLRGPDDASDFKPALESRMVEALKQKELMAQELEALKQECQRTSAEARNVADSAQVLSTNNAELVRQVRAADGSGCQ